MSEARYTPIIPGDDRGAGPVNAIFTALGSASASLTAVNFAEEGLDSRVFEDHPVGEQWAIVSETTRAALAPAAAFVQYAPNGTAMRLNAGGGFSGVLGADEALRVRARVWFESTIAAGVGLGGPASITVFLGKLVRFDGVGTNDLVHTTRVLGLQNMFTLSADGVWFTEGWVFGPLATVSWVEMRYILQGTPPVAFPSKSMIWGTLFKAQRQV